MQHFYTEFVSDELKDLLKVKGFPITVADMGFTVPQMVDLNPTYADVLDWLIEKGFHISILDSIRDEKIYSTIQYEKLECDHCRADSNFVALLETSIKLMLELL